MERTDSVRIVRIFRTPHTNAQQPAAWHRSASTRKAFRAPITTRPSADADFCNQSKHTTARRSLRLILWDWFANLSRVLGPAAHHRRILVAPKKLAPLSAQGPGALLSGA